VRRLLLATLACLAAMPLAAASKLDTLPDDPDALFADRAAVHALVIALEEQPKHEHADLVRAVMMAHYEKVDYLICGDAVLGKLMEDKKLVPIAFQMIIASGDWVEAHPGQAKDIDAYTLAGLESGVRAYRNLLKADANARNATLDGLVKEYEANTLSAWNKAHPCRRQ
jgi:hypothetical protein